MGIPMKALTYYIGAEGRVQPGDEIEVSSEERAKELEKSKRAKRTGGSGAEKAQSKQGKQKDTKQTGPDETK